MNDVDQHLQDNGVELAPQACYACRKQKRKCDKRLPMCSLCQRLGRSCDYTIETSATAPTSDDFAVLQQKVSALERLLTRTVERDGGTSTNGSHGGNSGSYLDSNISSTSSGNSPFTLTSLTAAGTPLIPGPSLFPSLFFLDSACFQYERFQIQAPYLRIPPVVLSALGSSAELRGMIEKYFVTVHTYFPIVSKIRLYQHLASPAHEPGADIALLFLAMKLIVSDVPAGTSGQTQLYQDMKSFLTSVEAQNGFSIQLVQALLLISLFELGHSIYPACYLSIGHIGRLAHAMGLHSREAPQMLPRPSTWTEQEERRRVWWAVIILDRFVSVGHTNKPFATSDPSLDTHLPTDDSYWDRGQMLVAAPLALSASQTIRAAPFARTCQASHLLGKVIRHTNDTNLPMGYKFDEALQLHRTIRALAVVLPSEAEHDDPSHGPTLCTSMAICYSGLLTLYDNYSCTERAIKDGPETQLIMQQESIEGIKEISNQVLHLARRVRAFLDQDGIGRVSPLIIECIYAAAANYAWYVRESSDQECALRLAELKEILALLQTRWAVAGQYLYILSDIWEPAMCGAN